MRSSNGKACNNGVLIALASPERRVDRSSQTDARAKLARPEIGIASDASQRGDDFALGRDRRPAGKALEAVRERRPELDVEAVDRPQDPRDVARVREPVLAAGEVRLRLERVLEIGRASCRERV